jgi:glycosyltransferase involved in cell wall biosynthesis
VGSGVPILLWEFRGWLGVRFVEYWQKGEYLVKACIVMPYAFSPPHSFTLSKARALQKWGFEVTIVGVGRRRLPRKDWVEGMKVLRARHGGIYYSPFVSLLNPLVVLSMCISALRENGDLYYCRGFAPSVVALALKLLGKRVIYDVGDDIPSNFSLVIRKRLKLKVVAKMFERFFRAAEGIVCRRVDYVTTFTESLRRDRLCYTPRIKTIPYCLDPVFHPNSTDGELASQFNGSNVIVYSGTVSRQKGLAESLAAMELVRARVPNTVLVMVGGAVPEFAEGRAVGAFGDRSDVMITGWLPYTDMPRYICLGKVGLAMVNPINYSFIISIPFKLLEQMACGLPVIACRGFPEVERVIRSADAGILVDPDSPQEIADAVIRLLEDENLRALMGRNARKYIEQHHSLERMEREWLEVCCSVLGEGMLDDYEQTRGP